MPNRKSIVSIILYIGSALCFLLPFVSVSCQGTKVFTLTGQQLATGSKISVPSAFGPSSQEQVKASPFATFALLCAITGAALSLFGQRMIVGSTLSGGAGALSLMIMKAQLDSELQKQLGAAAQTSSEYGYSLTLLLFLSAAGWNVYQLFLKRHALTTGNGSYSPNPNGSVIDASQDSRFARNRRCSNCGSEVSSDASFCGNCGKQTN
jgi:hypothetical protein